MPAVWCILQNPAAQKKVTPKNTKRKKAEDRKRKEKQTSPSGEPDGPSLAREVAQAKPGGALKKQPRDTT